MSKISIIVPVYNEEKAIKGFVAGLKKEMQKSDILSECIVVDDGSNDGTAAILKQSDVVLLRHNKHLGYGASLKTGIKEARGDIVCIIDADNTYFLSDIQRLALFIDQYDMVVGARIKDALRHFPFYQRAAKAFVCLLLALIFKQEILDINSGLRLMRKDVAKKYFPVLPDGFSFTAGITLAMLLGNDKIKYLPVGYSGRTGKSKVKVFGYTINFIKSYWRIIRYFKLGRI